VLGVPILTLAFESVPTVWYVLFFHFIDYERTRRVKETCRAH